MNKSKLSYFSKRYLNEFSNTTSLKKLNDVLSNSENGTRLQYVLAGYLFYNKNESNLIKYPQLKRIYKDFVDAINNDDKLNPYYKVNNSIKLMSDKKKKTNKFKADISIEIQKIIKRKKLSINFIAKEMNMNHSTLHRFVINKRYTEISQNKSYEILQYLKTNYE